MNICLLTPTFLPKVGGAETVVAHMAQHFHNMGHNVCVVTQHPRQAELKLKAKSTDHALPYPVVRYTRPWSFAWPLALRSIHKALQRAHRQSPFDLIHCHMVYPVGTVALDFARSAKIPVVITAHGSSIRSTSRYRKRPAIWQQIVKSLAAADLVTAISPHVAETLSEIIGQNGKIKLIPNGVDIDELAAPADYQPQWPSSLTKPFILYLGGLKHKKGVDILLAAMKSIEQRAPGSIILIIAGDGADRPALQQYVRANNLTDAVTFLGLATGQLKRYLLQNCHFVVMPSRTEAMPIVALEALACGKPVLASAAGGLIDMIHNNANGILVQPENVQQLADAIRDLSAADRSRLEANARSDAKKYAWPNIAKQYIQAYQTLLQNH